MLRAELTSSIRAIHFKSIVTTVRRNQSEVVQGRGAKRGFLVGHRTADAPNG
jgi:hypothetical protein